MNIWLHNLNIYFGIYKLSGGGKVGDTKEDDAGLMRRMLIPGWVWGCQGGGPSLTVNHTARRITVVNTMQYHDETSGIGFRKTFGF